MGVLYFVCVCVFLVYVCVRVFVCVKFENIVKSDYFVRLIEMLAIGNIDEGFSYGLTAMTWRQMRLCTVGRIIQEDISFLKRQNNFRK